MMWDKIEQIAFPCQAILPAWCFDVYIFGTWIFGYLGFCTCETFDSVLTFTHTLTFDLWQRVSLFTAGWHAFKALILSLLRHCVLIRVSKNHDQKARFFFVVVVVNFFCLLSFLVFGVFCLFVYTSYQCSFLEDVKIGTQTVQEPKGRRFCRSQRGSGYRLLPLACSAFLIEIRTASSWMAPSSTRLGSPSSITNWENVL